MGQVENPHPAVQIVDDERYDMADDDFPRRVVTALREAGYVHNPAEVAALRKVAALARGLAEEVGDSDLLDALEALDAVTHEGPGEPVEPDRPLEDYTTWRRYIAAPADKGRA